jgi:CheY-like chemotaxis protein
MNREVVVRMLALEGAQINQAADGRQALDLLRAQPLGFDAVLMDVQMPVMDGLTATRAIRGQLGLTRLPVIALTAGVLPAQQEAARKAGVDAVLAKPLDLEQLVARLLVLLQGGLGPQSTTPMAAAAPTVPPDQRPATTEPIETFPAIPGIDHHRAAQTLGHDLAFFQRLLQRFADECADAVPLARHDLDQGQRETAARRLHTLRGMAGYLGALDLMQVAGDLEQAITAGETGLDARLVDLGEQVAALTTASAPWRGPADGPAAAGEPTPAPGPRLDPERFAALCVALRLQKASARRLFRELEPAMGEVLDAVDLQAFAHAIDGLRFDEALALLDRARPA